MPRHADPASADNNPADGFAATRARRHKTFNRSRQQYGHCLADEAPAHPYSEKDAESWIAAAQANTDPLRVDLLIVLNDGTVAGATDISPGDYGETKIGYYLGESHWGNGLATEAAQGVIDMVFSSLDIECIVGRCSASNRGSRRVLEKCGFQYSRSGMTNCLALNASVATDEFVLERGVRVSLKRWGAK